MCLTVWSFDENEIEFSTRLDSDTEPKGKALKATYLNFKWTSQFRRGFLCKALISLIQLSESGY